MAYSYASSVKFPTTLTNDTSIGGTHSNIIKTADWDLSNFIRYQYIGDLPIIVSAQLDLDLSNLTMGIQQIRLLKNGGNDYPNENFSFQLKRWTSASSQTSFTITQRISPIILSKNEYLKLDWFGPDSNSVSGSIKLTIENTAT